MALVEIDVKYFLSFGTVACSIPRTVTYSTEFGDDFVVTANCCSNAVDQFLTGDQLISYLDGFCIVEEVLVDEPDVPAPGSEVEFNDGADDGEDGDGVCTLLSGATQNVYMDAEFAIQYAGGLMTPLSYPQIIDNRMCCLAYDADGVINNSYELTFACEEIEVREDTPVYNPDDDTCTVESEVFFYVDLDANTMYDPEIDGEQFAYDLSTTVDETGDACCQKAADDDDLATANLVCDRCVEDDTQDEYFTYEAPVCTRRFDRITTCYLSTSVDDEDTVYVDETHCVEEILDATACCEAKQAGKAGVGLEDACSTVSFIPQSVAP